MSTTLSTLSCISCRNKDDKPPFSHQLYRFTHERLDVGRFVTMQIFGRCIDFLRCATWGQGWCYGQHMEKVGALEQLRLVRDKLLLPKWFSTLGVITKLVMWRIFQISFHTLAISMRPIGPSFLKILLLLQAHMIFTLALTAGVLGMWNPLWNPYAYKLSLRLVWMA